MQWQTQIGVIIPLLLYLIPEIVISALKKTPGWLLRQVFGAVYRLWRERAYLYSLLRDEEYARWMPETQRYVALNAIRAQEGSEYSGKKPPNPASRPLLDLLQERLKRRESVLVLGDPGAGKTTAFRALTCRLARTAYRRSTYAWFIWLSVTATLALWSPWIALLWLGGFPLLLSRARLWVTPFFLELHAFFSQNAREFLTQAVQKALGDVTSLDIKGRCVFLLDGMNEIHRGYAARFLETWRAQTPAPLAFLSSRTGERPAGLAIPATLQICELDDEGVRDYLKVYLQEKAERQANRSAVDVETDLAELQRKGLLAQGGIGRNPYWLWMMVWTGLRTRNRGRLFLGFTQELIGREVGVEPEKLNGRKVKVKPEERKRKPEWAIVPLEVEMDALAELALAMNREHQVGFEGKAGWKEAQEVIRRALGDRRETPTDVLGEAEAATLIRQRYNERVEFCHQLVQEFFAAYALRPREQWGEVVACCEDLWWWETLFLLGGLAAAAEAGGSLENWAALTKRVLRDSQSGHCLFVATGLLCCVENPLPDLCDEITMELIAHTDVPLTEGQQRAVQELGRALGDEAAEAFRASLLEPDRYARIKGAALLCALRSQHAVDVLLSMLCGEYVSVLVPVGAPAVEPLIKALQARYPQAGDSDVRREAEMALGEVGRMRVIVIPGSENWRMRREAAEALGELGDTRAVQPLIVALVDEEWDLWNKPKALEALEKFGETAVEALIAALGDESEDMRQRVARALGELGDTRAVEPLIAALGDESSDVQCTAAVALRKLGDARAVQPLIAALGDEEWLVRQVAAAALGKLGDTRAVEPLIAALGDRGEYVRQEVAEALGKLRDTRAVEPLITALGDRDVRTRWRAAGALGELGDTRAVEPLIAALGDEGEDKRVRQEAACALGKLGDTRAVKPLIATLGDDSEDMRQSVARALGDITGQYWGQNADRWQQWWSEQQQVRGAEQG